MSKAHIPEALRETVRERARGRREYCQIPDEAQVATFHCDHCIPKSKGGPTTKANLAWACPRCNGSRLAATHAPNPQTGEIVPLFNPRGDRWDDHFQWSGDFLTIQPKTPAGRATVELLKMNRPKLQHIRALMMELGLHPAE
jgi:hypothetical protein